MVVDGAEGRQKAGSGKTPRVDNGATVGGRSEGGDGRGRIVELREEERKTGEGRTIEGKV